MCPKSIALAAREQMKLTYAVTDAWPPRCQQRLDEPDEGQIDYPGDPAKTSIDHPSRHSRHTFCVPFPGGRVRCSVETLGGVGLFHDGT